MPKDQYSLLMKFIIVGDPGVGKSSLLQQFVDRRFSEQHDITIGVEFGKRLLDMPDGETIKLQIWDTAGAENYRSVTRSYYRGSAAALLVYDITDRASFDHVTTWLKDIRSLSPEQAVVMLVGTKVDLASSKRQVPTEEGQSFADANGLFFRECSSLERTQVDEVFTQTAEKVYQRVLQGVVDPTDERTGIRLSPHLNGTWEERNRGIGQEGGVRLPSTGLKLAERKGPGVPKKPLCSC